MKINPLLINNIKASILGLIVFVGMGYVFAGYTIPTCAPTGCNSDAPIDSTSVAQAKSGRLIVGTFDTTTLSQYVFSVKNALAYIQALATNSITLIDGTEADGLVLTAADDTGLATWRTLTSSVPPTKMYVDDFRLYVKRNAGTVSVGIPSTYQYCSISQLGPDFANSNNVQSECSVNQNNNKSWTLKGQRGDDPGFWCNARCFSVETKPVAEVPVSNPVITAPKQYYCLSQYSQNLGNSQFDSVIFGCSTTQNFDPSLSIYNEIYTRNDTVVTGSSDFTANIGSYITNSRRAFADQACGSGNWTITPSGANENLSSTDFKCN